MCFSRVMQGREVAVDPPAVFDESLVEPVFDKVPDATRRMRNNLLTKSKMVKMSEDVASGYR